MRSWRRLKITFDHCLPEHPMCVSANCRRAFLWRDINFGFLLGLRSNSPASRSLLWAVDVDTLTPCCGIILAFVCKAVLVRSILLLRTMIRSCLSVVFRLRQGILMSLILPVIRYFFKDFTDTFLTAANSSSNLSLCIAFFRQRQSGRITIKMV